MSDEPKQDPIEGLQITHYDTENQIVTIKVHRYLLKNPKSIEALQKRMKDIIEHGPSVNRVDTEPRE